MRGLASFAMTGRYRALLLAVASAGSLLFAWVGAAIVALVTLRKGAGEGLWLLLWASLPALIVTRISGDSSALALLLGTGVLAMVLRSSVSMTITALASAAVAVATGLALLAFGQSLLAELAELFAQFFAAMEKQSVEAGGQAIDLRPPTLAQLAGMMGTANGALSFLCLALARYWQAALYNPGGFGQEFRGLQLPRAAVWVLAVAALALVSMGLEFRSWGAALMLPLTIAGFALLHARAAFRGQSSFWLGGIYAAWLVFDAAKLALIGLVVVDSLINFRGRWQKVAVPADATDESRELQEPGEPESEERQVRDDQNGTADTRDADADDGQQDKGDDGRPSTDDPDDKKD